MPATVTCHGVPSGTALTAKLFADGDDTEIDSGSFTFATNRNGTGSFSANVTGMHKIELRTAGGVLFWFGFAVLATSGNIEASDTRDSAIIRGDASAARDGIADLSNRIPTALVDDRIKAEAEVDPEAVAAPIIAAIEENGLAVTSATPEFLSQLQAAAIVFRNNPPVGANMTLYSGCDHLQSAGNAKSHRNPAGSWPNLSERTVWTEIHVNGKSTREQAVVVTPTGVQQEVVLEMRRATLVAAGLISGEGEFVVVAVATDGERIPLGGGSVIIKNGVVPAA